RSSHIKKMSPAKENNRAITTYMLKTESNPDPVIAKSMIMIIVPGFKMYFTCLFSLRIANKRYAIMNITMAPMNHNILINTSSLSNTMFESYSLSFYSPTPTSIPLAKIIEQLLPQIVASNFKTLYKITHLVLKTTCNRLFIIMKTTKTKHVSYIIASLTTHTKGGGVSK